MLRLIDKDKDIKWDDIPFDVHPVVSGGVSCRIEFPNGMYCSIVGGGSGLYGDGVRTFEIMSSITGDDVEGFFNKEDVLDHLNYIRKIYTDDDGNRVYPKIEVE